MEINFPNVVFFFNFKELEDNKSVGERKRKVGIKW